MTVLRYCAIAYLSVQALIVLPFPAALVLIALIIGLLAP